MLSRSWSIIIWSLHSFIRFRHAIKRGVKNRKNRLILWHVLSLFYSNRVQVSINFENTCLYTFCYDFRISDEEKYMHREKFFLHESWCKKWRIVFFFSWRYKNIAKIMRDDARNNIISSTLTKASLYTNSFFWKPILTCLYHTPSRERGSMP